jgi:hypothetical protein
MGRIYISRDAVFDESVFPFATPGVTVDIPTLRDAITFPSSEPTTSYHVHNYDLPYLSIDFASALELPLMHENIAPQAAGVASPALVIDVHGMHGSGAAPDARVPAAPTTSQPSAASSGSP